MLALKRLSKPVDPRDTANNLVEGVQIENDNLLPDGRSILMTNLILNYSTMFPDFKSTLQGVDMPHDMVCVLSSQCD